MRENTKILSCLAFIILVIIANVFASSLRIWNRPVTVRIGPLNPKSSNIILYCNPSLMVAGDKTVINGRLVNATSNDGIAWQDVYLYYKSFGSYSWIYVAKVTTTADGSFSYLWNEASILTQGFYIVNATFLGNNDFDGWTSLADLEVISSVPDFELSCNPCFQLSRPGEIVTFTVTVTSINGFNSPVTLTGYAQNFISVSFNPETVTPAPNGIAQSTLTVIIAVDAVPGVYQIIINGKSEQNEHTISVTLEVYSRGEPDFQIIAEPSSRKISQGESTFYVISIKSLNAFSSEVRLSAFVDPPCESIMLVFDPELVTPPVGGTAQSKLRISTLSSVAVGTYEINITGVGGERTHQTKVRLDVAPAFNWDETLSRFVEYKEMYQVYRKSFFNNSWWHELAQQHAEAAATYDSYKESINRFVDAWLDYFEMMTDLPISPISHMFLMKDLAESLIDVYNMFLAMYLDNVAMCVWASYSRHDIRTDLDLLTAKINMVIQALNAHDSDALTSALHELQLATENAFAGSKSFDDAIYDVILTNPAYDLLPFLTRTKIYNGVRQHILSFRETLMLSYNDITLLQGKAESLNEKRQDGILSSRWNMPIVQDAYWEVSGVRVTQAQKGKEVKAHVIIRTLNISSVEYDIVEGLITVVIKKDIRFWFDKEYAKMSWNIKLNPGETVELVLPFIPDEASSITLKGYFIELAFSGKYLFPNHIISDSSVNWDDGSKGAMKDSYPPRLTVFETSGMSQSSGTVVMLTETQHRLYLHIYDENGRHVGLNYETGTIETQIPSCSYYDFNNGTAIVLPLNMTNFKVIVDAKYAQEENESYELTVITIKNYEVLDQKNRASDITKGAKHVYMIHISQEGEIAKIQNEETIPWWIQHQLWIIAGVIVIVAVATATIAFIRKQKRYKTNVCIRDPNLSSVSVS